MPFINSEREAASSEDSLESKLRMRGNASCMAEKGVLGEVHSEAVVAIAGKRWDMRVSCGHWAKNILVCATQLQCKNARLFSIASIVVGEKAVVFLFL